jgi:hypothetical protein
MSSNTRMIIGGLFVSVGIVSALHASPHHAAPRAVGGGAPHASAGQHGGGPAVPATAPRGHVPPRGTAIGVAHYGHDHRGPWIGRGYWGGWYPWWGVGWYDAWGWPGYGYYGYAPWYPSYVAAEVETGDESASSGPASVVTAVTPSKAEVELDGASVGFARDYNGRWDKLSVPPGHHEIVFKSKGCRSLAIEFDARPGASYAFNDTLADGNGEDRGVLAQPTAPPHDAEREGGGQASATGRLRLHVDPADAAVYLDGAYLGLGAELAGVHGALAVATGSHRLEAVRPGYASVVRTIEVGETDTTVTAVVLERER